MDSLDVIDTCKRLITKLNMHFVNGEIPQLHTIHESNYTVIKLPRSGKGWRKIINKQQFSLYKLSSTTNAMDALRGGARGVPGGATAPQIFA